MPLSDVLARFGGLTMELMSNPYMSQLSPPFTLILAPMGRCIRDQGIEHISLGEQSCGFTLLRCGTFPLPAAEYKATGFEDLKQLLGVIPTTSAKDRFGLLLHRSEFTPLHSQWISNVPLHLSWAWVEPHNLWVHDHRLLIDGIRCLWMHCSIVSRCSATSSIFLLKRF